MYQQAKDAILQYIEANRSQGNQLPSEMDFAKMMGVSRNTVREALKILENEGLVYSRHGVGTFIVPAGRYVSTSISSLKSLTEIIRDHKYTPGTTNMDISIIEADARISDRLSVQCRSKLLYIERVLTADKVPVAYVKVIYSDGLEKTYASYQTQSLLLFLKEELDMDFVQISASGGFNTARFNQAMFNRATIANIRWEKFDRLPKSKQNPCKEEECSYRNYLEGRSVLDTLEEVSKFYLSSRDKIYG